VSVLKECLARRKADQRNRQNYYCLADLAVKLMPFRNVYFNSKPAYINRCENFSLLVAQNPEIFNNCVKNGHEMCHK
jgi:hypothetical protein